MTEDIYIKEELETMFEEELISSEEYCFMQGYIAG